MNQSIGSIYHSVSSIRRDFSRIANKESHKMRRKVLQHVDDRLSYRGISNAFMSDQEKIDGQKVIIRFLKGKLSDMTMDTIRANLNHIFQDNGMKNGIVSAIVSALNEWGNAMEIMPNRFHVSFTNNRQDNTSNIVITDRINNDAIIIESELFIHPDVYSALNALSQDGLRAFFPGQHGAFLDKESLPYSDVSLNPQILVENAQISVVNSQVSVGQNQNEGAFSQVSVANSHVSVGQNQPKCDPVQGSVGSSQDGWGHRQDNGGNSQLSVGNNQGTILDERDSDGSAFYNSIDLFLNTRMASPQKNGITKEAGFMYYGNVNADNQPHDPSGMLIIVFDDTMYNKEIDDTDSQRTITVNHKVAFFKGSFSDGDFERGAIYNVKYVSDLVHDPQYVSRFSGILLSKQTCDNTVMYHYCGKLDCEGFPEPLKALGVSFVW